MVQKRDKAATEGRGFQESRLQYQKLVRVNAREACTFVSSCPTLKLSCEDVFYEKAMWLFPFLTFPLFARSTHAKTDKRCFCSLWQPPQHARQPVGLLDRRLGSHQWFNRLKAFYLPNFPVVFKTQRIPL